MSCLANPIPSIFFMIHTCQVVKYWKMFRCPLPLLALSLLSTDDLQREKLLWHLQYAVLFSGLWKVGVGVCAYYCREADMMICSVFSSQVWQFKPLLQKFTVNSTDSLIALVTPTHSGPLYLRTFFRSIATLSCIWLRGDKNCGVSSSKDFTCGAVNRIFLVQQDGFDD